MTFQLRLYNKKVNYYKNVKYIKNHSLKMTVLVILKRANFCLNSTSDSDMTMSDGRWFHRPIVWYEKNLL